MRARQLLKQFWLEVQDIRTIFHEILDRLDALENERAKKQK